MDEFSLEKISDSIHYGRTKEYFREVLSSYQNGNYRSAVVMLWSVAICDIVYKLQNLIDLYDDGSAKAILDEVSKIQELDQKSAAWELKLIDEVNDKTNLLDSSEYENLRYLQKQRHLSAHPVLNRERELHSPNKETVRALIRNTLTDILIKPPFYTQHILQELLDDISESREILNDRSKVKKYVVNRYFDRTTVPVELNIFRSLWKIVFRVENEQCETNRLINLHVLEVIATRNKALLPEAIRGDVDFFSNLASAGSPLQYLIFFLSENHELFPFLSDAARLKVEHYIENDPIGKTAGWFVKENIFKHGDDLQEWIVKDKPVFSSYQFDYILQLSDSEEWQEKFCMIASTYYGVSTNYDQADSRFQVSIPQYIKLFNENSIKYLAGQIEKNSQCHDRGRARHDYTIIKARIDELFGGAFDYTNYYWFSRKLGLAD